MALDLTPEIQAKLDAERAKYWQRKRGELRRYVCRFCLHRVEALKQPPNCPECGKVSK